jgi:hypothetical protein
MHQKIFDKNKETTKQTRNLFRSPPISEKQHFLTSKTKK